MFDHKTNLHDEQKQLVQANESTEITDSDTEKVGQNEDEASNDTGEIHEKKDEIQEELNDMREHLEQRARRSTKERRPIYRLAHSTFGQTCKQEKVS